MSIGTEEHYIPLCLLALMRLSLEKVIYEFVKAAQTSGLADELVSLPGGMKQQVKVRMESNKDNRLIIKDSGVVDAS